MNKTELTAYIAGQYGVEPDSPWADSPEYKVFRHGGSKKWFALIMTIPAKKLGLSGGALDVVNLKCDPMLIGSLTRERGVFPAWHMNKTHWITVALDGSADSELTKMLLDASFTLTAPKRKQSKGSNV